MLDLGEDGRGSRGLLRGGRGLAKAIKWRGRGEKTHAGEMGTKKFEKCGLTCGPVRENAVSA